MLVYGDHQELCDPAQRLVQINRELAAIPRMRGGLARHAALVGMLVETGRLLQAIADAEFEQWRLDRRTAGTDALNRFLFEIARAVCRSWDSGFDEIGRLPPCPEIRLAHFGNVALKLPEGFAFYAVYPEAFVEAARRLKLLAAPRVIGIRSIGTSLAAVVAAALGAPPPVTVRPFGDPYDRTIAIGRDLQRELLGEEPHFIIVDEGPGQSGSSFGAVCDWLQQRGVPLERIALLPSHAGDPGAAASEPTRARWHMLQRQPGDFGNCWPALLHQWCSELLGPLDLPLQDISGGKWRRLRFAHDQDWPAAVPAWERRKFLARTRQGPALLKFAGLGELGERKLAIARSLFSERLVPEPLGLVHGYLAERWLEEAVHLAPGEKPLAEIAHYIATRARLLPATSGSGASAEQLLVMARRNVSLELGEEAASALDRWDARARDLERRIVRIRTDSKLDRHEWLRASDGSLIKTDAVDHHEAHDLIGCQGVEWDVAGAIAEFDLDQNEAAELVRELAANGACFDGELLDFCRIAYTAFRLGLARMGAQTSAGSLREAARLERLANAYATRLGLLLESSTAATRPASLVG